jgi:hypothetical protein
MRWGVMLVLALATATMFAVSLRANYLYGYGIGQTPETRLAIAWANVGADLWKGFGLIAVVGLWRTRWRRAAMAVFATWLVCLSFSVSSAIGIYVQERTALTSGREAKYASYEDAKVELAEVERQIRSVGQPRPVAQIEAAIAGVLARSVRIGERVRGTVATLSVNCSKNDARTSADCIEVAELRGELAAAVEAARLHGRLLALREQVTAMRERGSSAAPDPVGEFWAWMTRGWLSVKDVSFGLPLFFALMIEMVSAFGPVGIAAYAEATRPTPRGRDMARSVAPQPSTAGSVALSHDMPPVPDIGRVVHYMAERTQPSTTGSALGADELVADYEVWCLANNLRAMRRRDFLEEFDRVRASPRLSGKIRKFGSRYFGIALVENDLRALRTAGR